ncbi:protein suppressor of sable isoform X1 [Bactrocera neohumeralis]|uniref:protein suppressor of sable isoform X1 n=1 Tax=Bactrocera neohumeralis TaxID=98809 RepID=UPI00216517CD|nr:protein suppressor of sable isoform X1 [Bactrocera neohumeralis]XP_050328659.1 protein suppressor of sable isoform X1 [Bactrocera neohumeralis]XP_050328661.1 protein suppressor of sable isoform X1 [Bactrocera neohumeralis]XP_050328662.1 protein suppressor of sable isoform X1 [Bactrocera neohumeralis]XP_050328663.1 protein suppressor of sable isoform X1 [Bactrocera neohumeralis]
MSEESNTVSCDAAITTTNTATTNEPTTVSATKVQTEPAAANMAEPVDIEDLEDGEIDDDEDDNDVIITNATTSNANNASASAGTSANDISGGTTHKPHLSADAVAKIPIIDLSHEHTPSPTSVAGGGNNNKDASSKSRRNKKGLPPTDDYMEEVEKSLSNILNKAGVKPQIPKCLESRQQETKDNEASAPGHGQSRSSRRRKRKKQRDEREKEKERKDKDKSRYMSPEPFNGAAPADDDEDDFEMLNVVGGSPSSTPTPKYAPPSYPVYDSADDSYTSYDSGDSLDGGGERGGGGDNKRRRRRNKKDRKRGRDRRARSRDDSARGGAPEKRSRRDSNDDKHRQEPRKMELCKFYLMECCAKKDKCSYMHSDFPCKYYYLGMECPNRETCKFMHEAPLSEQLRNILLKHLETAPKEILGNFKRMSRENAIALITKRNEELCKEYKVENTWSSIVNISTGNNRRGNQGGASNSTNDHHQHQSQPQQQQQPHSNIPSLFDIVVKPPVSLLSVDKHRKSRWADSPTREPTPPAPENNTSAQLPSYLDLKNLEGIMKTEHIQKLTQLGITNLQEINQFTFGQLQKIGIDFVEISEVQKKVQSKMENKEGKDDENNVPTTRDVDMRSIPSATTTTNMETLPAISPSTRLNLNMDLDSNSNNSGVMRFEYSQYLKDSNLAFDRNDAFEDERDEEQLVIDDGNMENEENARATTTTSESDAVHDEPPKTSDLAFRLGMHLNPYNPFRTNPPDYKKSEDKSLSNSTSSHIGYQHHNERRRRSRSRSRSPSRSRSRSRSRSQTPTRTQSTTPEASDSADNDDGPSSKSKQPVYERKTMYDFNAIQAEEDERKLSERSMKNDKDMRYLGGSILPLDGVMNYTPATEIDGSISSHLPRTYKVHEFAMPPANYADLRRSLRATTHTADPRVRRILGLPETRATTVALKRSGRKLSNTIASPEADESPKYYTPPSTLTASTTPSERRTKERRTSVGKPTPAPTTTTSRTDPRLDPRCAAASAATAAAAKANEAEKSSAGSAAGGAGNAAGDGINAEITGLGKTMREKMQSSDWYRKLNSNMKIQYNQELARLITELRRFHQDTSPDKNFNFINCNKKIIDDILIQLGIFIDENGEVNKIESDKSEEADMNANAEARVDFMQQSDFPHPQLNMPNAGFGFPNDFRFPPPLLGGGLVVPRLPLAAAASGISARLDGPSLLGMPPMSFNPFGSNAGNFQSGGPGQMPFGFLNFQQQMGGGGGGGGGPGNFNMGGGHNRRNPHNRRNFI